MSTIVACALGCASAPAPEQRLYWFNSPAAVPTGTQPPELSIVSVSVPAYLRRREIMLQLDDHELRPARHHHWAEPLQVNIHSYLAARLASDLATPIGREATTTNVKVEINQLHSHLQGRATLSASYQIQSSREDAAPFYRHIQLEAEQEGQGYAPAVAAQQALLDSMSRMIAADLGAEPANPAAQ
ncbi:MAG: PqiC family protein [Pseudomonadota bacterium]